MRSALGSTDVQRVTPRNRNLVFYGKVGALFRRKLKNVKIESKWFQYLHLLEFRDFLAEISSDAVSQIKRLVNKTNAKIISKLVKIVRCVTVASLVVKLRVIRFHVSEKQSQKRRFRNEKNSRKNLKRLF